MERDENMKSCVTFLSYIFPYYLDEDEEITLEEHKPEGGIWEQVTIEIDDSGSGGVVVHVETSSKSNISLQDVNEIVVWIDKFFSEFHSSYDRRQEALRNISQDDAEALDLLDEWKEAAPI
tara:strand:+ start:29 stop:391 length:363 start_codon:yes stop_codon:yes gene_type:complete